MCREKNESWATRGSGLSNATCHGTETGKSGDGMF